MNILITSFVIGIPVLIVAGIILFSLCACKTASDADDYMDTVKKNKWIYILKENRLTFFSNYVIIIIESEKREIISPRILKESIYE